MNGMNGERHALLTTMEKGRDYEASYKFSDEMDTPEYHCHDFYEIYLHLRGGQYFGLDNSLYLLKPNQMIIIPPFSMHGLSSPDSKLTQYERAYLNLSPELMKTLGCGQIDLDQFFRSYTSRGLYTFWLSGEDAARCVSWLRTLQSAPPSDDPLERFSRCALLMDYLMVVCRGIRQSQTETGSVVSNSIIQNVLTYINSHYTQPLKMDQLAKQFGISVSYLSHEFVKFTNRSVYDYILYRRVMLARQMMQTDASLNAIAYQCGFNDYSNFLRIFSKLVGVSPSQFRKDQRRFRPSGK